MIKLLVQGHVPKWFGGKQVSGLSNVMYSLAEGISQGKNIKVFFNATDITENKTINNHFKLLGWNIKTVIYSILLNFSSLLPIWINSKQIVGNTGYKIKLNLFLKRLIFKYRLKLIKPQVIHFHGIDFFMFKDLIDGNVLVIVTIHHLLSNDGSVNQFKEYRIIENKLINNKRISKIFFVSTQVKNEAIKLGYLIKNNRVVLNAIDTSIYKFKNNIKSVSNRDLTICTIGSVCNRKGQKRVVEACLKLNNFDKITYYLIGGGDKDYISSIQKLSSKSNIVDVKYLGIVDTHEIVNIYSESDFMILPSIKEGFGMTTMESISCGTKVIVTNDNPLVDEGLLNHSNSILINDHSIGSIINSLENIELKYNKKKVSDTVSSLNWVKQAELYEQDILSICGKN